AGTRVERVLLCCASNGGFITRELARLLRQTRHPAVEPTTSTLNLDSVKSVPGRHIRKDHGVGGLEALENLNVVPARAPKFNTNANSFRAVVNDLQQRTLSICVCICWASNVKNVI